MLKIYHITAESSSVYLRVNLWDFEFGRGKGVCPVPSEAQEL